MSVDVVYMVREGERNEELRHSLRSLVNLAHDRVWIAGHKPAWVSSEVGHIPVDQSHPDKHERTWSVWWAMAHMYAPMSDQFVMMNDDHFVMRPVDRIDVAHAGPLLPWVAGLGPELKTVNRMRHTIEALSAVRTNVPLMSYEVHVPMVLYRHALAEVMAFGEHYRNVRNAPPLCKRSLYGNYFGLEGELTADPKVRNNTDPLPDAPIVSTLDRTFNYGRAGMAIAAAFPDPCTYERPRPVMARVR